VNDLLAGLPSVERVVQVGGPLAGGREVDWRNSSRWESAVLGDAAPSLRTPSLRASTVDLVLVGNHGLPKAMVHSQGGILLTHLKEMALQNDLRPGDRLLFLGSTSWAVWNLLVGALVTGASIVLYDGHPSWPDGDALWRFMDENEVAVFGCGAAFLIAA
jgi:acetoacetyl-CoA synthetase